MGFNQTVVNSLTSEKDPLGGFRHMESQLGGENPHKSKLFFR